MNVMQTVKASGKNLLSFGSKNSHIIMGIGAIGGLVASVVMAYKARPAIDDILEEKRAKMEAIESDPDVSEEDKKELRKEVTVETVKAIAPKAAPTVVVTLATAGLMTGSFVSSDHKIKKFMGIAAASDIAYKELFDKTKEIVGEDKAQEIQKEIAQDRVDKEFKDDGDLFESIAIQAVGGDQLFYDAITGRVFKSDIHAVYRACEALNHRLTSGKDAYIDYNDFFTELCLNSVIGGEAWGWGGFSLTNVLEPNLNNTVKVGDRSAIVVDWYTRPTQNFK